MKLVPTALAVAGTILVMPTLTGFATGTAATGTAATGTAATSPVASAFDAGAVTTLASNGIEQVAAAHASDARRTDIDARDAADAARRAVGGDVRAAVLGPFTDYSDSLAHRLAWQVLLTDTVLPDGELGRAWVAVDPETGDVLAAKPLLEIDAT